MGGQTVADHGTPAAEDVGLARGPQTASCGTPVGDHGFRRGARLGRRPRCQGLFDRAVMCNVRVEIVPSDGELFARGLALHITQSTLHTA